MPKNSRKSTLFLDIGGVLLTNGWDRNIRQGAARHFNLETDEMLERHHLTFDTYEVGKLSLDEYLHRVVFYKKRNFTVSEFKKYMFGKSKPFPDMIAMMRELKSRYKLKVAVVSNEGLELNEYRIKKFKLGEFIDFFISSCYVHYRKPDPDIYKIALNIAQVPPGEVIYIDDRPLFIQVASELGIDGILHTEFNSTKKVLASMGLVYR
ncbi:MAG TPA: HAD family phosphatase [Cyclobacteriaceae bacterium]|nr:HAD family phosphatase [Cyclobacteriaceae bacterium]